MELVLVTACLGGRFGIICPRAYLKILKLPRVKQGKVQNFQKLRPKNRPNQTCNYWLITQNQQALCIKINYLLTAGKSASGQLQNNTVRLTVQCLLKSIV